MIEPRHGVVLVRDGETPEGVITMAADLVHGEEARGECSPGSVRCTRSFAPSVRDPGDVCVDGRLVACEAVIGGGAVDECRILSVCHC